MIDWGKGGLFGSIEKLARRDIKELQANNAALREQRYPSHVRLFRWLFAGRSFFSFISFYLITVSIVYLLDWFLYALSTESSLSWYERLREVFGEADWWEVSNGYLIGVQTGVLSIVSIAIGLVTILTQRTGHKSNITLYYNEALPIEVLKSSIALLLLLILPVSYFVEVTLGNFANTLERYEFNNILTLIHLIWLSANLLAFVRFISLTFLFVRPVSRSILRRQHVANVAWPEVLKVNLKRAFFGQIGEGIKSGPEGKSSDIFNIYPVGEKDFYIKKSSEKQVYLYDAQAKIVRWALRYWERKCRIYFSSNPRAEGYKKSFFISFDVPMETPLQVSEGWCYRHGGIPSNFIVLLAMKWAFSFRSLKRSKKSSLVDPSRVLEELADETIREMHNRSLVGFEEAYEEFVGFYQFMVRINAITDDDGDMRNYLEVQDSWLSYFDEWDRHYRHLFDAAFSQIAYDSEYARRLAFAPNKLLRGLEASLLSKKFLEAVVGLGLLFSASLGRYYERNIRVEFSDQKSISSTAFQKNGLLKLDEVLLDFQGAWGDLTRRAFSLREVSEDDERWKSHVKSWDLLWEHLFNTTYIPFLFLNYGYGRGSKAFAKFLLGWRERFRHHLDTGYIPPLRFLSTHHIRQSWSDGADFFASFSQQRGAGITPSNVFSAFLSNMHANAVVGAAALSLYWVRVGYGETRITNDVLQTLLGRTSDGKTTVKNGIGHVSFSKVFFYMLRVRFSSSFGQDGSFAGYMESIIVRIDRMRERPVPPGESYTPSTLGTAGGLNPALVALLLFFQTKQSLRQCKSEIKALVSDLRRLPNGAVNLIEGLEFVERTFELLEADSVKEFWELIPNAEKGGFDDASINVREFLEEIGSDFETAKEKFTQKTPVDDLKIRDWSLKIHDEMFQGQTRVLPFADFEIIGCEDSDALSNFEWPTPSFSKGGVISPQLDYNSKFYADTWRGRIPLLREEFIWASLTDREREAFRFENIETIDWVRLSNLMGGIHGRPILRMPSQVARAVWNWARAEEGTLAVEITYLEPRERRAGYLVTVEGIDVYEAGNTTQHILLFSNTALVAVGYSYDVDEGLSYVPDNELEGHFVLTFGTCIRWSDEPVFEVVLEQDVEEE